MKNGKFRRQSLDETVNSRLWTINEVAENSLEKQRKKPPGIRVQFFDDDFHSSDPSLNQLKISSTENQRRKSAQIVSTQRRRSTFANLRRPARRISRYSRWHIVRSNITEIAMMNEDFARRKLIEGDPRWSNLRQQILERIVEMREISFLRKQNEDSAETKTKKISSLKSISFDEVVHLERDGKVYSIATRDLILGRLTNPEDVSLDTLDQLVARRRFQVKQTLLRRQQGRTRFKRQVAFTLCLFNILLIVFMFVLLFLYVIRTVVLFKTRAVF